MSQKTYQAADLDRQRLGLGKERGEFWQENVLHMRELEQLTEPRHFLERIFLHGNVLILQRRVNERHDLCL